MHSRQCRQPVVTLYLLIIRATAPLVRWLGLAGLGAMFASFGSYVAYENSAG
ncbi:hypothetical protein BDQ94DRAFT_145374 [Aspergillus welwitschiae]|uniref:Uncharacterized protein n=1 Tax=Aspergillus welwitschiae TaxID=1341132 RepID=A0A3F3Q037_9EURO|nr:hypothetical protein BDQ94DRAFT_145374 [Aspergillus welwitschiae]RDH32520.1 hypothetical protein BDQ94DRAFT_145374 [Aspergillus welwitschiae]